MSEPSGPMLNGMTYIVRPSMQPLNSPCRRLRMMAGASQLLVAPAYSFFSLQIKVRSSTRATSRGSERARKLPGRSFSLSLIKVPAFTSCSHKRSYSSWLPSHQYTDEGWHNAAISLTQDKRAGLVVGVLCESILASSENLKGAHSSMIGGFFH